MSYDIFKYFVRLDQDYQALKTIPLRVKQHIHAVNMFYSYAGTSYNTSTPSVANNTKKEYLSETPLNAFTYT